MRRHLFSVVCAYLLFALPFGTSSASIVSLSPDPLFVVVNESAQMTITIDQIADIGGEQIDLVLNPGIFAFVPTNILIPEGQSTAVFDVTGILEGSEILTATEHFGPGFLTATINVVPIPSAIWLFGSALLGMIGIARRKKAA